MSACSGFLSQSSLLSVGPSVGVVVVAYNAASTLTAVLDRIPNSIRNRVTEVVVCDDASSDNTYSIGVEYQKSCDLPLTILRRARNLGYGGNQKAAYRWAIESGLDIVVLLHGDGQYAPEVMEDILAPFESPEVDAVFGSRFILSGGARLGGMPLYKYAGNRILSRFANSATGLELSEWHSGYRAYRVSALSSIPFEQNSDGFDFDTEIILQLHEARRQIVEVPIPTYYGDELCYVNGPGYAKDVVADIVKYRLHRMGFGNPAGDDGQPGYEVKSGAGSSHMRLLSWISDSRPKRILDLGCSDGRVGELLRKRGHYVVGVDAEECPGVHDRLNRFLCADLDAGLPPDLEPGFDLVMAADVLEHLRDPATLLKSLGQVLVPGGLVMVSVPNISHWYGRLRVLSGRFDYDRRGIFDAGHLRFFTLRSFERTAERAGMAIRRRAVTGLPLDALGRGGPAPACAVNVVRWADSVGVAAAPSLFGYQLLFELEAVQSPSKGLASVTPLRTRPVQGTPGLPVDRRPDASVRDVGGIG
jgi:glycosyltransferase involved in cell wall biosynthesis